MDTSVPSERASRGSQATVDPNDSGEFIWYHDLVWMRRPVGVSTKGAAGTPKHSSPDQGRVVCVKLSNGQQVKFSIRSGEQLKHMIDSIERAI